MNHKPLQALSIKPMRLYDMMFIRRIDQTNESQWPLRYYIKSLSSPHFYPYVARLGDTCVGSMMFRLIMPVMHIDKILIDKSYRRRGIGGKLFEKSIGIAKKKGALQAFLAVSVSNKYAVNFYSKYGFRIESIQRNYYATNDDGLKMVRFL
ncbi:MAG: GNAT family N-acetyltransferase [Candidatus Magnetomorum sp.]|nr:GNAT family N-acetyltransferase [Candidatus Magnetomorum sp.]